MTKEYDRKVLLNRQEFIALRSVLSDWYGDDRAELEIGAQFRYRNSEMWRRTFSPPWVAKTMPRQ